MAPEPRRFDARVAQSDAEGVDAARLKERMVVKGRGRARGGGELLARRGRILLIARERRRPEVQTNISVLGLNAPPFLAGLRRTVVDGAAFLDG